MSETKLLKITVKRLVCTDTVVVIKYRYLFLVLLRFVTLEVLNQLTCFSTQNLQIGHRLLHKNLIMLMSC